MSARAIAVLLAGTAAAVITVARADDDLPFPSPATFTTRAVTPLAIEGLTGDSAGRLYTTGRQTDLTRKCPIWRVATDGSRRTVAFIPNTAPGCNPSGITFDSAGDLYVADGVGAGTVWRVTPDATGCEPDDTIPTPTPACASLPTAGAFVTGVPGTNGLAFDLAGFLWTGDGTTGVGRVWKIAPGGGVCESATVPSFVGCEEAFRIQPMRNAAGVGRSNQTLQPVAAPNPQPLVANGVAFTRDGDLYVADTARGALWKIEFDRNGAMKNRMGCDTTFLPTTLCLDSVFVAHPYLEGTDGIALDRAGNIWNAANERNAVVMVTKHGSVMEVFRTPVNADTGLRNDAPAAAGDTGKTRILEFPTSPFLLGNTFCVAQSDGDRRDNSPRAAGEINGGAGTKRGKISCMDQPLETPGLPLPVR